ncbi:MAG: diphthine synthase [Thermoplasmataceae archaeon]
MTVYILGIGMRGVKSFTIEEAEIVRNSSAIYLEGYTSFLPEHFREEFESYFQKEFTYLSREKVEVDDFSWLVNKDNNVSILIPGDPFVATTHTSLIRALELAGEEVEVRENASIVSSIPFKCNLTFYRFGQVVSIPKIYSNFVPGSPLKKILVNLENNLHTIALVDIFDGRNITTTELYESMVAMMDKIDDRTLEDRRLIIASRINQPGEKIMITDLKGLPSIHEDLTPYTLIIPAKLDSNEKAFE